MEVCSHPCASAPSRRSRPPGPNHRSRSSFAHSTHAAHGRGTGRVAEGRAQLADEGQQVERRLRLARRGRGVAPAHVVGVAEEVGVPVLLADDAGGPADALPARRRHCPPIGATGGHVAEQRHHGAAAQAAAVELEQLGEDPGHHAFADARAGAAVPRDAGSGQLVLDEAGVRAVGGEQHGDAVEAVAGAGGVDHGADARAHFVVGVGRRRHGDRAGRSRVDRRWLGERMAGERLGECRGRGVGLGIAGEPDDDLDGAALGERSEQLRLERTQPLGEVDDDVAEPVGQLAASSFGGPDEEIALVVPVLTEQAGDVGGDAGRLGAPRCGGEGCERTGAGGAHLAVEVAEGDDGRGVVVDGGVHPG